MLFTGSVMGKPVAQFCYMYIKNVNKLECKYLSPSLIKDENTRYQFKKVFSKRVLSHSRLFMIPNGQLYSHFLSFSNQPNKYGNVVRMQHV